MKEKIIAVILMLVGFYSCKESNKTETKLNNDNQSNEILASETQSHSENTLKEISLESSPHITIIDTIDIKDLNLFTLNIHEQFQSNGDNHYPGSFLALLKDDFNPDSIFKNIVSLYPIIDDYMSKDHFSDLSDKISIDKQKVIKYAYCGGGAADVSDIIILTVSQDSINRFFYLSHWDYYYNDLDLEQVNDSIVKLTFTSRDDFGHFHEDYYYEINTKAKKTTRFNPPAQSYNSLSSTPSGKFILYKTLEEANARVAYSDSVTVEKGNTIKYDSVYWDKKVFKVNVPNLGSGYVNFEDPGINIPVNNAG